MAEISLSPALVPMVIVSDVSAAPPRPARGPRVTRWVILPAASVLVDVGATLMMTLPVLAPTRLVPLGVGTDQLPLASVVAVPDQIVDVSVLLRIVTVNPTPLPKGDDPEMVAWVFGIVV